MRESSLAAGKNRSPSPKIPALSFSTSISVFYSAECGFFGEPLDDEALTQDGDLEKSKRRRWRTRENYFPSRIEPPVAKTPAIAPVIKQARVAASRALKPMRDKSRRRDGTRPPVPPTKTASDAT